MAVEARAARGDAAAVTPLQAITLLDSIFVRLAFHCICLDRFRKPGEVGEEVYDIGCSVGHRIYGENAQEDIHGYIRTSADRNGPNTSASAAASVKCVTVVS